MYYGMFMGEYTVWAKVQPGWPYSGICSPVLVILTSPLCA